MTARILTGHVLDRLRELPSNSVHMCVTSPPYYGLRSYGTEPQIWGAYSREFCDCGRKDFCTSDCGKNHQHDWLRVEEFHNRGDSSAGPKQQSNNGSVTGRGIVRYGTCRCGAWLGDLGLETTPGKFVEHIVEVFREVRRVLRPDGTLWLNFGDSYAGSGKGPSGNIQGAASCGVRVGSVNGEPGHTSGVTPPPGWKAKDLFGIPWMVAFALREDGWYLRSDIIWDKPNPMPESVTDRPTRSHEYLFLLAKSREYFYDIDAVREPIESVNDKRYKPEYYAKVAGTSWHDHADDLGKGQSQGKRPSANPLGRNRRSVWRIPTEAFPESHFATFPSALVEPCIKAGTSEKGCCANCGAPAERIVEKAKDYGSYHNHVDDLARGQRHEKGKKLVGESYYSEYEPPKTIGWETNCKCLPVRLVPCTVLDPFLGSGTTAMVSDRLGRDCVGIELNPEYADMARRRIVGDAPMFTSVVMG